MPHCKECQQACLNPYASKEGTLCRNCYEKKAARWAKNWDKWEPERWEPSEKGFRKKKKMRGVAHPSMDSRPRHTKEEADG
jgi:hypothetical protein